MATTKTGFNRFRIGFPFCNRPKTIPKIEITMDAKYNSIFPSNKYLPSLLE